MSRSKVAILKTKPDRVREDIDKLFHLAEAEKYLEKEKVTILKCTIILSLPMLTRDNG